MDNEYPESIEIHDNVQISIRAIIIAHTRGSGRVIIEKEAFVGANSVIACSADRLIRIGERAVIGPGAIITKSVPAGLYVVSAPPQCVARVEVPLTTTDSIESFRAGLRPLPESPGPTGISPESKTRPPVDPGQQAGQL